MANRFINGIFRAVEGFLSIALLVVLTEVIVEVSARYIFHAPLAWGAEVSQTLLVWITFMGAADAFRRKDHMSVSFIYDAIPSRKVRKGVDNLSTLILAIFLVVGFWSGWQVVARTWSMQTTALQIPAGILYLALPVGFMIMLISIFEKIFHLKKDPYGKDTDIPAGDWR